MCTCGQLKTTPMCSESVHDMRLAPAYENERLAS